MNTFVVTTPTTAFGFSADSLFAGAANGSFVEVPKAAGPTVLLLGEIGALATSSANPIKLGNFRSAGPRVDIGSTGSAVQVPTTGQIWPSGLG